jgi:hypothetical protein
MTRFGLAVVGTATALAAVSTAVALRWRHRAEVPVPVAAPGPAPAVAPTRPGPAPRLPAARAPEGDPAADVIADLGRGGVGGEQRERLVGRLRGLPGRAAEDALIAEAKGGPQPSTRTMAMDALAERRTDRAFEALATIARNDPDLPAKPLIAQPRRPDDTSVELPDEQTFTPRMQAMAALAGTGDGRAVPVLAEVARQGPDESLRMEAARHLGGLRDDPRAAEALRAAASDPSAYVRLAALHSLARSSDPALPELLARIAQNDSDAGVRLLAQQLLANLGH